VRGRNLGSNSLIGTIPTEIGLMTSLAALCACDGVVDAS
jgi:hypothetical protein